MQNLFGYDAEPHVCFGIDKIALGIESKYLNYKQSPPQLAHAVDIINWGNWSELNIQLETNGMSNINFSYPLVSVLYALRCCLNCGVFAWPLSYNLYCCINSILSGMMHPIYFLSQYFQTGIFKLDEYELYFDFYGYNPFQQFDKCRYLKYQNTVYTRDYLKKGALAARARA